MREKQIAIFVDGSNLSAACRSAGFFIDYAKVLKFWQDQGSVINASYFTALPPRQIDTPLRKLIDWLTYNNWSVLTKETKDLLTSEGLFKMKGNVDVEIAVSATMLMNKITHFVLFSGDGDFTFLVKTLQSSGVHVTAVSHFSTDDRCQISDELRRQVNLFIDLKNHRREWELPKKTDASIVRRRNDFLNE
jgi:uncharacterized LabA/DUF88 family protein